MTDQEFGQVEFNPRANLWRGSYSFYIAYSNNENRIRAWLRNLELGEAGLTADDCHRVSCHEFPYPDGTQITVSRDPAYTAKKTQAPTKPTAFEQAAETKKSVSTYRVVSKQGLRPAR